ncbi:MAG: HAD-IB family hydrolase [Candidatus Accumulibacter sp.]|mgnify:FL=1|uniref:histidinol-phosphatase n=1 Tax=Accumulibacter sp. TaxID=2053492 RepID=UPI0025D0141B|nr:HAD family hydrolase [Accumulibacter sp.]MCM8600338.1 HAD-IB family hydrolase [Accumulibacter sp.]MCM8664570.1 HAD-IB family hydrolase [Accumulibacter sp.]HNC19589.1 HAD family hydrolase [Accumulibacter sp.]
MDLALFDLDNTLIAGDSDFEWAQFLIGKGILDRALYEAKNLEFYEQYKAGTLDIDVFLDFQLQPLSRYPRALLDTWQREFLARNIVPLIGGKARALVRKHLDGGALCAIVTATNSFVTGPIVREFGIEHLIATIPAQENGQFTGLPRGLPSFREGKIVRVESWLEALGLWWSSFERSWFYSDSLNDLPLLSKVSNPVVVDPDPTLRAHAEAAGWPIVSLRA